MKVFGPTLEANGGVCQLYFDESTNMCGELQYIIGYAWCDKDSTEIKHYRPILYCDVEDTVGTNIPMYLLGKYLAESIKNDRA